MKKILNYPYLEFYKSVNWLLKIRASANKGSRAIIGTVWDRSKKFKKKFKKSLKKY